MSLASRAEATEAAEEAAAAGTGAATAQAAMAAAVRRAPESLVHEKAEATIRVASGATEGIAVIAVIAEAANASSATAGGIGDTVAADVAVALSPAEEWRGEAAVEAPAAISKSRHTHL
jgi:hypothetical protein